MKKEIKNKYSDADKYAEPVCTAMPVSVFLSHLEAGAKAIYPNKKTQLENCWTHLRLLKGYFDKYAIESVVPGEEFIADLLACLMHDGKCCGKTYSIHVRKKVPRTIRKIMNEYLLPKGIINRIVLLEVEINRYRRFWKLTPISQGAIKWFEENGKVVEAIQVYVSDQKNSIDGSSGDDLVMKYVYRVTGQDLLPSTNSSKISAAIRVLDHVGKSGFEQLTRADAEKFKEYCDASDLKKKCDPVVDAVTFCINIKQGEFIKENPFVNISLKKTSDSVRLDFFGKEAIDKLKDLSTVDYADKVDIRDRAMVLVAYDLALRLNEFLALELTDLRKDHDGEWSVRLRSDVQKGIKDEETMYFFFPETKQILEKYLAVRDEFNPKCDRLFLSRDGKDLGAHCRKQFQSHFQKLGIRTYSGNIGSPHLLRHSFATLNVEPLGLALPIYEIMGRLRHARLETARKHYIHNNPYLRKQKHDLYKNRGKKKTIKETLNEVPLADLEHWLSDDLRVEPSVIKAIRSKHKKASVKPGGNESDNVVYLSEPEALDRLKSLTIPVYALRKYGLEKGFAIADGRRDLRYGKNFRYKQSFIEDLANNWIPAKDLMAKLKMTENDFYNGLKCHVWRNIKIGKIRYLYKADCL